MYGKNPAACNFTKMNFLKDISQVFPSEIYMTICRNNYFRKSLIHESLFLVTIFSRKFQFVFLTSQRIIVKDNSVKKKVFYQKKHGSHSMKVLYILGNSFTGTLIGKYIYLITKNCNSRLTLGNKTIQIFSILRVFTFQKIMIGYPNRVFPKNLGIFPTKLYQTKGDMKINF